MNIYIYIHMCIFIININFIDLFHIYIYIFVFCQLVSQGIRDASKSILANHPTAQHLTEMQQPVRIRLTATAKPKAMSKQLPSICSCYLGGISVWNRTIRQLPGRRRLQRTILPHPSRTLEKKASHCKVRLEQLAHCHCNEGKECGQGIIPSAHWPFLLLHRLGFSLDSSDQDDMSVNFGSPRLIFHSQVHSMTQVVWCNYLHE